ncbi:class I adenylate-forming enzyme family protein [Arthrobacter sp. JCM 19049]|uniref:AMP-binding protein n=1 Tax=Arthrobacter sp. JCM 19049 TaxID=1460643 RepID=UPI0006D28CAE|nr:class I adenylate-forming enzyme family protein [Arthrobacter sp. JCM 19049]
MPKAICRTRHSWQASVRLGSKILHATAGEISLIPGPLAHGLSLYAVVETLPPGHGTADRTLDATQVRELLESHRFTRVVAVPSILRRLLEQFDPRLLEGLRYAISGGENLPAPLRRRLQQLPGLEDVVEYYGTSEHSLIAYRSTTTAQRNASTGFAGTPFPGVQLHIAAPDQETGIGEIYVHSPLLASGYHPAVRNASAGTATGSASGTWAGLRTGRCLSSGGPEE